MEERSSMLIICCLHCPSLKMDLTKSLKTANFFSIQMDGSTDCANVEEELFLAIYFDPHCDDRIVCVKNKYFSVRQLNSVDASGLYECLNRALLYTWNG